MENIEQEEAIVVEHPLKNSVILQQLFDFLQSSASFKDWKNIRLVCKLWHSETLSRWRNNAVLCIVKESPTFQKPSTGKPTPSQLLSELQNPQSPYKLVEIPYQKYKLRKLTVNLLQCEKNSVAKSFWNLVGPNIRSLTCTKVNFESESKTSTNLLRFFIEKMPNLANLHLENVRINDSCMEIDTTEVKDFHRNLLSLECSSRPPFRIPSLPNLQELKLADGFIGYLIDLLCPSQQFFHKFGPPINSSIRRLDLLQSTVDYHSVIPKYISNLKFTSLEHFSVTTGGDDDAQYQENDLRFLPTFLKNHCERLRTVEIFSWIASDLKKQPCPLSIRWPVLSELRLWGNVVPNLSFLRFTPNLTLLHMDLYGYEDQGKMFGLVEYAENLYSVDDDMVKSTYDMGTLANVVLEKLEYFQINCPLLPESVGYLAEWMPNLKTLKAVLDVTTLPEVCEKWPKLEKLVCLFGSFILDENVIGSYDSSDGNAKKGLTDLKYLKSFQYDAECGMSSLTDLCITRGFLQMKELADVKAYISKVVTQEAEELLKSRIQYVELYRNYAENKEHEDWECCAYKNHNWLIKHYKFDDEAPCYIPSDSSSSDSDD